MVSGYQSTGIAIVRKKQHTSADALGVRLRAWSGDFKPQREMLTTHIVFLAFLESGVSGSALLALQVFSVQTQEDQPAKASDGFGQKVNDEGFFKVISAAW